jgi:hypothetical protein
LKFHLPAPYAGTNRIRFNGFAGSADVSGLLKTTPRFANHTIDQSTKLCNIDCECAPIAFYERPRIRLGPDPNASLVYNPSYNSMRARG